jgi:hypothetical protein
MAKPETIKLNLSLETREAKAKLREIKFLTDAIIRNLGAASKTAGLVKDYSDRMIKLESTACLRGKAERMRRMLEWVAGLPKKEAHRAPARVRALLKQEADHELRNLNQ